jgi:hypothetical protein
MASSAADNNDFLAKAQAATQRIAASAVFQQEATPEQAKIVEELAQDRPTIHAAVTSFLSLMAARSLVTPTDASVQAQEGPLVLSSAQALQCSRALLKAINGTALSATSNASSNEEYLLVAQLWNGLIASEQKPARFLGRRALLHAWVDVKPSSVLGNGEDEKVQRFIVEFERLLFFTPSDQDDNDDAALIWSVDGGKQELEKRRERRQKRATDAVEQTESNQENERKLPFIEELNEDDEELANP